MPHSHSGTSRISLKPLSDYWLDRTAQTVERRIGLYFPPERRGDLERGLGRVACELGYEDLAGFCEWLESSTPDQSVNEALAGFLTVGETYFFRQEEALNALAKWKLPELVQLRQDGDRRIKIWSAGCCTGEEAYSIAIQVSRSIPDYRAWDVNIIATDVNRKFLAKARSGVYGRWSLRNTPNWLEKRFLRPHEGGKVQLVPFIRRMVSFSYLNLADDQFPTILNGIQAFDVIFCCNVLIYFKAERAREALERLHRSLVEGGWLIVGSSDLLHIDHPGFERVDPSNPCFLKKSGGGARLQRRSQWPDSDKQTVADHLCLPEPEKAETSASEFTPRESAGKESPNLHTSFVQDWRSTAQDNDQKSDSSLPGDTAQDGDRYERALKLYQSGQYDAAVQLLDYRLTHPEAPDNRNGYESRVMVLMARVKANLGDLSAALSWCDRAIASDSIQPEYHYLRSNILQEMGDIQEAIKAIRRVLFLDPESVLGHFTLGTLIRNQGRSEGFQKHFDNALRLLEQHSEDAVLSESEGIRVSSLKKMIDSMKEAEA